MNNWEQLSSIIDRVLDLDSEERLPFVEQIYGDQPELKAIMIRFLKSIEPSEKLWEKMVESGSVLANEITSSYTDTDTSQFFLPLKKAGPYRVIELIARGGMGDVYLAERSDGQFDRKVAIKILRQELSSKNHIKRFSAERNILSGLEHPNIARLYDGGFTDDRRPYLVMEFVDGVPITSYCIDKKCSLDEKFDLFNQVCKAVEYAHRNLIVHRDLKPDNIFVKPDGTVEILDFGIAKILDQKLSPEVPVQTGENLHMLSIQYAAPEQVTLEKITTATDVYALGLLLYEIITGLPPFDLKGKNLKEAEQVIRFEEPEKPSKAVKKTSHSKKIKSDLDAIILKALNKKPAERYKSVDQFLDDIQQYQSDKPVSARQKTFKYRTQKFITRRPGVVLAILVIMVAIGGYLFTLQLHAESLKIERDKAEKETSRAELISGFLVDLFESADPSRTQGSDLSVRDLLDRGIERVDALAGQPEVQAKLSLTMARTYYALGLYDDALLLVEQAITFYRDKGDEGLLLAEAMNYKGTVMRAKGDYQETEAILRDALAIQRRLLGDEHLDVAATQNNLGVLMRVLGEYTEAEILYRESLTTRRNLLGDEHPDVATSMNNLGFLLQYMGEYTEAETLLREALALQRNLLGDVHLDVGASLNNLGLLLRTTGDFTAAEPLQREALVIMQSLLGEEHPNVATLMNNLAVLLEAMGDHAEAESLYHESLAMRQKLLGNEHPAVAGSLNNLGVMLRRKGDFKSAEPMLAGALAIQRKIRDNDHPHLAISLSNLGALYREMGDYTAAEPLFIEALDMLRRLFGNEHLEVAKALNNKGMLLRETGNYEEAELLLFESLEIRRKILGDEHPDIANTLNHLGRSFLAKGDLQTAEELFHESLDMRRRLLGEEHPGIADSYESLYMLFLEQGEYEKALSKLYDVLDIRLKTFGEDHPDVITTRSNLDDLIVKSGNSYTGH